MNPTPVNRQAKQLIDEGRTADAVQLLGRHLDGAPDDHDARNMLAFAHFQAGDYPAAEAVYREMVAGADPDPRDMWSLGQTLEAQGKRQQARPWLDEAAAADPRFAKAARATAPSPQQGAPRSSQRESNRLGIPTDEALPDWTRRLHQTDLASWWSEHWYGLPWFVRLYHLLIGAGILAITAWVIHGALTFPS
jgi:tetratricopeptide (TPR) repeat protein